MKPIFISLALFLSQAPIAQAQWVATQEELDYAPEEITRMQVALNQMGYSVAIDGRIGPQTDAAMWQFFQDVERTGAYMPGQFLDERMQNLAASGWRRP